jgi:hypothetical protein
MKRVALIGLAAVLLTACGEKEEPDLKAPRGDSPSEARKVIRAWSDALRAGNIERAASYFALPSVVQNGTPPARLISRRDARIFNMTLPCGGRLIRTETSGRFTTGTFRLTKRPGANCGVGTGHTASTAFVIRDGKILEWRRVAGQPRPEGSLT